MNIKNFSLDWIQPSSSSGTSTLDPWVEAMRVYAPTIFQALQEEGSQTVQKLFDKTKQSLNVPQLQLDQFVPLIDRLILNNQLTLVKKTDPAADSVVALQVPKT